MIKALTVLVFLASMGIGAAVVPITKIASNYYRVGADTALAAGNVSCSFNGATVKKSDGTTAVTLSWNASPSTGAFITIGAGPSGTTPVVGATTTSNASSVAYITQSTTYLLSVGNGQSTSTCSFTASPA